jgi:hypothetical protein
MAGFLRVAIYAELFGERLGSGDAEVTVSYIDRPIVKMRTEFKFENFRDPSLFVVAPFSITLDKAGDIKVVAMSGGVTKTLITKRVRVGELMTGSPSIGTATMPPPARSA